jgi:SWI/SNF-related matrix-associated actin-dependent regulator 1 of chromatin subfamily A
VVMAQHTAVINGLAEKLAANGHEVGRVAGGMTPEDKADIVQWFQEGSIDVVVGQMEAAGVGLTLHASCHIVFLQLPWSPATFAQCTDRIYRIGQTRKCVVHVLNMVDGVSEKLWGVLQNKAQIVDAINNGKPTTIDPGSVVSAVLESYGYF